MQINGGLASVRDSSCACATLKSSALSLFNILMGSLALTGNLRELCIELWYTLETTAKSFLISLSIVALCSSQNAGTSSLSERARLRVQKVIESSPQRFPVRMK